MALHTQAARASNVYSRPRPPTIDLLGFRVAYPPTPLARGATCWPARASSLQHGFNSAAACTAAEPTAATVAATQPCDCGNRIGYSSSQRLEALFTCWQNPACDCGNRIGDSSSHHERSERVQHTICNIARSCQELPRSCKELPGIAKRCQNVQ